MIKLPEIVPVLSTFSLFDHNSILAPEIETKVAAMATERSRQRAPSAAGAGGGGSRKRHGSDETQGAAGASSNGKARRKRAASGEGDGEEEEKDDGDATEDDDDVVATDDDDDDEYSARKSSKSRKKKTVSSSQRSSASSQSKRRRTSSDDASFSQQQLATNMEVAVESANADEKVESEMGIIEEIYCENFMCHRRMKVVLSPHINFITGENGSGKSAIIAAIQVRKRIMLRYECCMKRNADV